jgi:hypothetical protein
LVVASHRLWHRVLQGQQVVQRTRLFSALLLRQEALLGEVLDAISADGKAQSCEHKKKHR